MLDAEKDLLEFKKKYASSSSWFLNPSMEKGIYKRYQR